MFATCLWVFKTVKVTITAREVIIGFNQFFPQRIKLEEIEKVAVDDKSYGGSGLRMRFVKGKFRIAYNTGQPRVVISIKNKRKEIVFSTNNPEKVIEIIERNMK